MQDDDDLKAWDRMLPVGREWGAPDAETLWALDARSERLQGTDLELVEFEGEWHLSWRGQQLARWRVSETDWDALRAAVMAAGPDALSAWDSAVTSPE